MPSDERFRQTAEMRIGQFDQILARFDTLTRNYNYSPEDVEQILNHMREGINRLETLFNTSGKKGGFRFNRIIPKPLTSENIPEPLGLNMARIIQLSEPLSKPLGTSFMSEAKVNNVTDLRDRDPYSRPIGERMEPPKEKPLLPVCHYFGKVVDANLDFVAKTGTKAYIFYISPREPGPDATPEQLKELENVNLSDYEFPDRQFPGLSPCILWRHPHYRVVNANREFFENMGFNKAKPLPDCANEMVGRDVLFGIGTEDREYKDREGNMQTATSNVVTDLTRDPRKK